MRRRHSREQYLDLVDAFARYPDVQLSTDMIVGFQGTEADFEETLS